MSVFDLEMRDVRRLGTVIAELTDDGGGEEPIRIRDLFASVGQDLADDSPTQEAPESSAFAALCGGLVSRDMKRTRKQITDLQDRVRAAVAKRHGESYTRELWERLLR